MTEHASESLTLEGRGLHSGAPCAVTLSRTEGPVTLGAGSERRQICELEVTRTDHGVTVALGQRTIDVVEHLLAAFGGLGVHSGVDAFVRGPELPLLDGGAGRFADAINALDPPRTAPALRVLRAGRVAVDGAVFELTPSDEVTVTVDVEFRAPLGTQRSTWDGSATSFVDEIAPARTFGFLDDRESLESAGRALGADPAVVMIFDSAGRVLPPGAPAAQGELARHKLLDLVGDTYLFGGPPRGRLIAHRPGHGATRRAFERARALGIVG